MGLLSITEECRPAWSLLTNPVLCHISRGTGEKVICPSITTGKRSNLHKLSPKPLGALRFAVCQSGIGWAFTKTSAMLKREIHVAGIKWTPESINGYQHVLYSVSNANQYACVVRCHQPRPCLTALANCQSIHFSSSLRIFWLTDLPFWGNHGVKDNTFLTSEPLNRMNFKQK